LRDFLRDDLPPDQPDFVRILFIETIARMLGRQWVSGDCSFVDVTIGTARLQEIIRALSFEYRSQHTSTSTPFVVLTTPYGEQHTLMLHLLGLLFDALGWSSLILEGEDARGGRLRTAIEQADIVCVGWSNIRLRPAFTELVETIKLQRPRTRPPIVTGGVAALESIDFLVGLGIDCICDSVYAASRICESFYELEKFGQQAKTIGRKAAGNARGMDWLKR
jgi:methanogenic corrinoid protein MtbC1